MNRADKVLTAAILIISLAGLVMTYRHLFTSTGLSSPATAVISVGGKVLRSITLLPDAGGTTTIPVPGLLGTATVEISGAKIRMGEAPCPHQICVKQGWIEHPGESIVCIPGEIVIHINGAATVDAVTR